MKSLFTIYSVACLSSWNWYIWQVWGSYWMLVLLLYYREDDINFVRVCGLCFSSMNQKNLVEFNGKIILIDIGDKFKFYTSSTSTVVRKILERGDICYDLEFPMAVRVRDIFKFKICTNCTSTRSFYWATHLSIFKVSGRPILRAILAP